MLRQITLCADKYDEEVILVLKMLSPLLQLVVRVLLVDRVAQDADTGSIKEQMRQIVHILVTGSIPNVQCQFMLLAVAVVDLEHLCEILHDISRLYCRASLRLIRDEGIDH